MGPRWVLGVAVAGAAALLAWGLHALVPAIPLLTAAVGLGMVVGQIPATQRLLDGVLKPGIAQAARRLLRLGIVLLGLKLSLFDIAGLGWPTIVVIVLIVAVTFTATLLFGRMLGLPGTQPILIAAGFSICGASAVGAMAAVTRSRDEDQATPIALVTLCGTLAIFILPALRFPLGMSEQQFGMWVGLSVHDVGQVVATAQIAGPTALAVAVVVKLTRVLTLAPMVAIVGLTERARAARATRALTLAPRGGAATSPAATAAPRGFTSPVANSTPLDGTTYPAAAPARSDDAPTPTPAPSPLDGTIFTASGPAPFDGTTSSAAASAPRDGTTYPAPAPTPRDGASSPAPAAGSAAKRPPIVPLFIAGFLVAVLIRTFVPVPDAVLTAADFAQTALLAMALFALGSNIRFAKLARTGWRALVVGLASWALIAALSLGAVNLLT